MRIIGYIEHPNLKITVFKMDNKLSVKFESGLYEQTYKFRATENLEKIDDIQKLVDPSFINAVEAELIRMHQIKNEAFARLAPIEQEDEFEDII